MPDRDAHVILYCASGDLPGLAALRTRMQWHQERQRVLAENVANSDTPNYKPRDLVEPAFDPTGASAPGTARQAVVTTNTAQPRKRSLTRFNLVPSPQSPKRRLRRLKTR